MRNPLSHKPLSFTISEIDNEFNLSNSPWKLLNTNGVNYKVRKYFNCDPDDEGVTVHDEDDNLLCELSGFSLHTQEDCEDDEGCEQNMLKLISAIEDNL